MKHHTLRARTPAALAAMAAMTAMTVLTLSACGGSDEIYLPPVAEDPTMVPASATANATAFSNYVAMLPASDSADPLIVGTLMAPVSDSDEPIAITR